jgi:uncharacterized protein YycO
MRNFHFFIYAISLFFFLLAICSACKKSKEEILKDADHLHPGDVVFRLGDSSESNAIMVADSEADYSHVGIAVCCHGKMKIIHACPSDHFEINVNNYIRLDSPDAFFDNKVCLQGAVYRCPNSDIAVKAADVAKELYEKKIPFDFNFDINDTTAMYCTELIDFAFKKAGVSLTDNKLHDVDIPGTFVPNCLLISDLQKSDKLEIISSFK